MKHWLTVSEAADTMGCSRQHAYRRLRAMERRLGKPVLVKRVLHSRVRTVVSAFDVARLNDQDAQLTELLGIKESLDAVVEWTEHVNTVLAAIKKKLGV